MYITTVFTVFIRDCGQKGKGIATKTKKKSSKTQTKSSKRIKKSSMETTGTKQSDDEDVIDDDGFDKDGPSCLDDQMSDEHNNVTIDLARGEGNIESSSSSSDDDDSDDDNDSDNEIQNRINIDKSQIINNDQDSDIDEDNTSDQVTALCLLSYSILKWKLQSIS